MLQFFSVGITSVKAIVPLTFALAPLITLAVIATGSAQDSYLVGVSTVDITPDYPIRLNGFGNRREESKGVSQRIFAKALAITQDDHSPLVLVTLDSLGIRTPMVDEVARRLSESHRLPRQNLAVTFTHSHCTPKVNGASDNIFSSPIPADHQNHIDRYTDELTDDITTAARQALDSMQVSELQWTVGKVPFAKNRRTAGGPVDHDLPMLVVREPQSDKPRAIYVSYACHCVTLSFNQISGDWAGSAAAMIERQYPGATALVSIGAGSDQNPISGVTGDKVDVALAQGMQIADEVKRLLDGPMRAVTGRPKSVSAKIALPLNEPPSRAELVAQTGKGRPTDRYNATTQLAKLDRGESLLRQIDYTIQTWSFGDSLCMTFLAGEVCVDYALRLKSTLDRERYWLNAYSNDFCSYIPSERLVREGGYGGGAEVPYFALPSTLKSGLEQLIIDEVLRQVPRPFRNPKGTQGVLPKSPESSLKCMKTHGNLRVERVAAEPQVQDPVAIDFGPDGRLWVAEMSDYGRGVYEKFDQNSRIRWLRDEDCDGRFETAVTFVDGLRFPTDVKVWRDGILICDAPEILFARDTNGDGKADEIKTLFSGFEVRNAQARVNSLRWGLDGWLYGSCGLFGGVIKSHVTNQSVDCRNQDFRIDPDKGVIQAVSGRTQQGRCRNDWGDWFGCSNGTLLRAISQHQPELGNHALHKPTVPGGLVLSADAIKLYPPKDLVRFELTGTPGQATSACGLDIYRDTLLGTGFLDDAFTCEPVNQSVHRIDLSKSGHGYVGSRGAGEESSEFLSSSDRWFRPVQVRTGPDGALWIVDMYRYVIEHSRWIPQSTLAELDVFAGQRRGRIYRVIPARVSSESKARSLIPNLDGLSDKQLAERIRSSNGTVRDLVQQMLQWRQAKGVDDVLRDVAADENHSAAQLQALATLRGLGSLAAGDVLKSLQSRHADTVRFALRVAEPFLEDSEPMQSAIIGLAEHGDRRVRRQVALLLDAVDSPEVTAVLTRLMSAGEADSHVRSAAFASVDVDHIDEVVNEYLSQSLGRTSDVFNPLILDAIRLGNTATAKSAFAEVVPATSSPLTRGQATAIVGILDALEARESDEPAIIEPALLELLASIHTAACQTIASTSAEDEHLIGAMVLLGRPSERYTEMMFQTESDRAAFTSPRRAAAIASLISPNRSATVQQHAVKTLPRTRANNVVSLLLDAFPKAGPSVRTSIIDILLSRDNGSIALLDAMSEGRMRSDVLDAARRQKLLRHPREDVRSRAETVLTSSKPSSRAEVLESFQPALNLQGDVTRGKTLFRKHCSNCHKLFDEGHVVGPNLLALTNRNSDWLLTAILDPNRDIDARYMNWTALTVDGKVISGLIVEESSGTIRLREAGGKEHHLKRSEIESIRSSELSVMPEGLEKDINSQELMDIIAYVIQLGPTSVSDGPLPRYAGEIAPFLLDESQSVDRRQQAIHDRPGMGPAILKLLVKDLNQAEPDRCIPWIWRVAVAVGKRNDGGEIRDVLELSVPQQGQRLLEWQAVVIGGGLINGISQLGLSPRKRFDEILTGLPAAQASWSAVMKLAAEMARDNQIKVGTRYDALRMVALQPPEVAVDQLKQFLTSEMDSQLQMGAVSGLIDVESKAADSLIVEALPWLAGRSRFLALEGMLRTDARADQLAKRLQAGQLSLRRDEVAKLIDHPVNAIRVRAKDRRLDRLIPEQAP